MSNNNKLYRLFAGLIFLVITGCYKNSTVILESGDEITRTVSFANDIIPIMNNACNMSGCHNTGGKAPDLSMANAYNTLTGLGYVNTENASTSLLYLWMAGKKGTPMPISGINRDYNALILAWIKQGALNN